MSEQIFNTRIIHKHDIEANWEKAINFIPKVGEIIVYDPDESHANSRIKIGDGVTSINNLKFNLDSYATEGYVDNLIENARPAETTSEDIIEWMGQESAIIPLASSNGQVYATNDNKILII